MKNLFFEVIKSKFRNKASYIAQVRCLNKKTLDLGCGFGDFLKYAPQNFIGIDTNGDALEFCRNKKYDVKLASVENLPFPDQSFDAIVALQIIEHLNPEQAYKMFIEAVRVLKNGGEIILSTEMATKYIWDTFSHVRPYTPRSIVKILSSHKGGEQETFKKFENLEIVGIYYQGRFFKNPIVNVLSHLVANLTRFNRRNYTMILRKTE